MTRGVGSEGLSRRVELTVERLLSRFPTVELALTAPQLRTVIAEVLASREVREAMQALGAGPAMVGSKLRAAREDILARFPIERRNASRATAVLIAAAVGVLLLLTVPGNGGVFRQISLPKGSTLPSMEDFLHYPAAERWRLLSDLVSPRDGWAPFVTGTAFLAGGAAVVWYYGSRAAAALRHWRERLRDSVLLEVRTLLNDYARRRGASELHVDRAPGLHGYGDPAQLVPPPAMQRVRTLTGDLGAGVIAISGARGVGKTTLLHALADPKFREPGSPELRMMIAAPVDYDAREFIVHLYTSLCELVRRVDRQPISVGLPSASRLQRLSGLLQALLAVAALIGLITLYDPDIAQSLLLSFGPFLPFVVVLLAVLILLPTSGTPEGSGPEGQLSVPTLALRRLRQLRFQQTLGLERAGGVRAGWLDLSGKASRQLADRPMSLPELVQSYREFAERVVSWWRQRHAEGSLVIAIDEVDRIADAAQAERFLNEVKAIFGVPYCTYLVSVSEEALASFERRVVRMRTALDSAFDEVLRIDALDLDRAMQLLGRRVIGVPEPFLALCHCLSGGLARDLIRVARALFDVRRDTGLTTLDELAVEVVHRELETLKRGFATQVAHLPPGPDSDALLDPLAEPGWPGREPASIHAAIRTGLPATPQRPELAAVQAELSSALMFYATVLEVFTLRLDSVTRALADRSRADLTIGALAEARHALPVSPGLVRRRLDRIRNRLDLPRFTDP